MSDFFSIEERSCSGISITVQPNGIWIDERKFFLFPSNLLTQPKRIIPSPNAYFVVLLFDDYSCFLTITDKKLFIDNFQDNYQIADVAFSKTEALMFVLLKEINVIRLFSTIGFKKVQEFEFNVDPGSKHMKMALFEAEGIIKISSNMSGDENDQNLTHSYFYFPKDEKFDIYEEKLLIPLPQDHPLYLPRKPAEEIALTPQIIQYHQRYNKHSIAKKLDLVNENINNLEEYDKTLQQRLEMLNERKKQLLEKEQSILNRMKKIKLDLSNNYTPRLRYLIQLKNPAFTRRIERLSLYENISTKIIESIHFPLAEVDDIIPIEYRKTQKILHELENQIL